MKALAGYLFLFLFGPTFFAHAQAPQCHSIFTTTYFQGVGIPGLCPDNIFYLARSLKNSIPPQDFKQTQVLYIYSRWTGQTPYYLKSLAFTPLLTKYDHVKNWNFHVALLYKGLVFDFDHNSENRAIPTALYFREMFGAAWVKNNSSVTYEERLRQYYIDQYDQPTPPAKSAQKMHVRIIPADIYLNEYSFKRDNEMGSQIKSYAYWFYGDKRFPDMTLEEFLKTDQKIKHNIDFE